MYCLRLLENLLQHEMRKTLLVNLTELQVNLLYLRLERLVAYCLQHHLVLAYNGQVAVIQVNDPLGILYNGSCIRGNKVLTVTDSDNKRRTLSRCKHLALLITADYGKSVCAFDLVKGQCNRLFGRQISLKVKVFHQVGKDLSVCLACKRYAPAFQVTFDTGIILNDSVMYHDEITPAGDLRVSVDLIGLTVCRPAGVAHGHCAVEI